MIKVKARYAVASALKDERVKFVFGIPGGHSVNTLYESLYGIKEINVILTRHEQSASFMGCCYAQATDEPGIIHGTVGPGVGNLVTGLSEALLGRWPLIAICPGSSRASFGKGLQQEFDQIGMYKNIVKWAFRIELPERIPWGLKRAFDIACAPPQGPVFLEIPVDIGSEEAELPSYIKSTRPLRYAGDPESVAQAAELISKSMKPVILAGGGIHRSKAWNELRKFCELLAAPILTTISGKGAIAESHPLYAGGVGICRTKFSQKVFEDADLVIVIGSQLEEQATAGWKWWPENAKFIRIDVDPVQIGRNILPDISIVGDAKLVLKQLIDYLENKMEGSRTGNPSRINDLIKLKEDFLESIADEENSSQVPVRVPRMLREIKESLSKSAWAVVDVGQNLIWSATWPYFQIAQEGHFIAPSEYVCMGFGAAGVIAVKLANPKDQVVCITGDGGFQMVGKEMITAVQYKAPVTWFIMNNYSLGWIKWFEKEFHGGRFIGVDFEEQPDFVKWAQSQKCFGVRVERPGELREAIDRALKSNREGVPALVDIVTSPMDVSYGFQGWHYQVTRQPA